ncbi:spore germination protein [Alkaliphilus transvaalensis]|uniref:spore germination protein n=1 Tax=Alkaliphilus transvaalensis TaxID=114628 RepID=UPI000A89F953|nr:spore germination protein [Alkaliphilus transvaalensis]
MDLRRILKNYFASKSNPPIIEEDFLLPESKGPITKENIIKELIDLDDAVIKDITVADESVTIIYMHSLVDLSVLQQIVLDPLYRQGIESLELTFQTAKKISNQELPTLILEVLKGSTILINLKRNLILSINTLSAPNREPSEPESETTVLGPQYGFVESLNINLSLIRRAICNPALKSKIFPLGTETRNEVSILYMENIANPENVERVFYRVKNIEFQGFFGLGVLKQMLEDKPYSPFPQFGITQRVDAAVSALLDGRILVFLNGSPEAAICPTCFTEMFISTEDYYNRWTTGSLLRLLRILGFFATILLTPTYISILTFHPEVLPIELMTLLTESRARVPFPPLWEVLIIELVIEILREAGARMPSKVGQTLGIVGGIVIGTAAVEAGLASNILIVLVAISALLSFMPPNFLMSNASRFVRYIFIFAAGILGFLGQTLAFAFMINHLLNITSLGTPYMTPFIPRSGTDLFDGLVRAPIGFFTNRKGFSRAKKSFTRPLDEE